MTLGLIIDLTDTDRYYDKGDVEGMCIPYEKINCPGRGFADRDDLVDSFNAVVDNFLDANADNGWHKTPALLKAFCGILNLKDVKLIIKKFRFDNWCSLHKWDQSKRLSGLSILD